MTMTDSALRAALRLYPVRYRRERGEEMAATFAETTAGSSGHAAAREVLDLAAYGLRLRLGLASGSLPARLAAMAAPFAVGAAAGVPLALLERRFRGGLLNLEAGPSFGVAWVPALLAVVAALFGRWAVTRALAVLGALAVAAQACFDYSYLFRYEALNSWGLARWAAMVAPPALWALMLLAIPSDLLPRMTWARRAAVLASMLTVFAAWRMSDVLGQSVRQLTYWDAGVLCLALAAVVGAARGRWLPAALAVTSLPLLMASSLNGMHYTAGAFHNPVFVLMLPALAVVVAIGLRSVQHPEVAFSKQSSVAD